MPIDELTSNPQLISELGKRIRRARIDYPLTQAELAKRAGVSVGTVHSIENGKDITLGSLANIMRALGMLARMDTLLPVEELRPSELMRQSKSKKERQRVRISSKNGASRLKVSRLQPEASDDSASNITPLVSSPWKWGDEE